MDAKSGKVYLLSNRDIPGRIPEHYPVRRVRRFVQGTSIYSSELDHRMGDAIAGKDAAEVTLANQEPALLEMHRYTCSPRAFDEMDMTAKLPITHPVAQPHDRLEQPRLMREGIVFIAAPRQ